MGERPIRIQRKRSKGWKMPEGVVYVGRPTFWGNPFIADDPMEAVSAFRQLIRGGTQSFDMGPGKLQFAKDANVTTLHWNWPIVARHDLHTLRGRNLACWCPLVDRHGNYTPCHADVLLSIANDIPMDEVINENIRRAKGETSR